MKEQIWGWGVQINTRGRFILADYMEGAIAFPHFEFEHEAKKYADDMNEKLFGSYKKPGGNG